MRDLLVSHCTRFFSPFSLITFPPTIAFSFSCPILANEMRCSSAYMPFDRPHSNRIVCPYHVAISYAFDYRGWQVKHGLLIQTKCVGAVPVCPPERPRSGVSIPKNTRIVRGELNDVSIPKTHALCAGIERWMRPCRATRAGT